MPDYTFVPCGDGTHPAVCIVAPQDGTPISEYVGLRHGVNVDVVVSNFTLKAPGECQGEQNCGHIHIRVTAPPATAGMPPIFCDVPGHPYNTAGPDVHLQIDLDVCLMNGGMVLGPHDISAALFDDNHQPIQGAATDATHIMAM
jgi:hypothetical protein